MGFLPTRRDELGALVKDAEFADAPLAVLLAGFNEDQLCDIADALERVWTGPETERLHADGDPMACPVPIVPLSTMDMAAKLSALLEPVARRVDANRVLLRLQELSLSRDPVER